MAQTVWFPDGTYEVVFNPVDTLRRILNERLGRDATELFDSIVEELEDKTHDEMGDDYEKIADGYHSMLLDTMDELSAALEKPKLDRKTIQHIYDNLYSNL